MTVVEIDQVVILAVNRSCFIGFCATGKLGGVGCMSLVNEVVASFKSSCAGRV